MPPFMGQSMCAWSRDVWNIYRKLDAVMRGDSYESMLDSYEVERKAYITEVIKLSIFLVSIICIPDEEEAAKRDALFLTDMPLEIAPFPHITDGTPAGDVHEEPMACAGLLSPHGIDRHQRRTNRLDCFLPAGKFILIFSNGLSESLLSEHSRNTYKNDLNYLLYFVTVSP